MSRRTEKIGELIKEEVSKLIQQDLRDPRLGMVTVTRVEASPDLRYAKIFFSVIGDEETKKASIKVLQRASRYLRRELAPKLQIRYVPELVFSFDAAMEHGDKIQRLLIQLEQEEKERASQAPIERTSESQA